VADERERIEQIRRRLSVFGSAEVQLGIGDDCALLRPSAQAQAVSVDAQVEHVHFTRELLAPEDIGWRALTCAVSDLAAMGARARAAFVAMNVPAYLPDAELYAIADGFAAAQREHGCAVAGGNLAAGRELSITTTVIGDAPATPVTRAGAKPGDVLYVTGTLGGAALGLHALRAGRPELAPACVARFRRCVARLREGTALASVASAAIDVSDGLLSDLGHVARASAVGFELELPRLPTDAELGPGCAALGLDPLALALAGGEDYELLFTAPAAAAPRLGTRIGTATSDPGIRLRDASGRLVEPPGNPGFDHFRGPG
jgi:thiamine-monophosphate kinase